MPVKDGQSHLPSVLRIRPQPYSLIPACSSPYGDRLCRLSTYTHCAGHNEVVQYLLEAGAVCNEYTFDGDRCHYAALTLGIRMLLRQFEARPPPLSPLATSLRGLSSLCDNPEVKPTVATVTIVVIDQ